MKIMVNFVPDFFPDSPAIQIDSLVQPYWFCDFSEQDKQKDSKGTISQPASHFAEITA